MKILQAILLVVTCFLLPGCITNTVGMQAQTDKPRLKQENKIKLNNGLDVEISSEDEAK